MKKTMIALAAVATLATSGAAFAQASITGFFAFGYGTSTTGKTATGPAGTSTGGFGVDTAELYISASEDLGGGMSASGRMGFGGLARGEGFYGHNYLLAVSHPLGKLSMGAAKSGDYISSGLASSGVNYYDFGDKGNFGARSNRDFIALDVPVSKEITLTVSHQEGGNVTGAFGGAEGNKTPRVNVASATLVNGPIKVNSQYLGWDNQVPSTDASPDYTLRLSGNYNLGMATVGAGIQRTSYTNSNTAQNIGASVAVPLGAITLGAMVGQRETAGYTKAADNGTQSSFSLNASYALSKRTGITGQFSNWDNGVGGEKSTHSILLLTHSF